MDSIRYKLSKFFTRKNRSNKDSNVATLTLSNNSEGANGFSIKGGNSYTTKLVVSRVIDSAYDLTNIIDNDAEVIGYRAGTIAKNDPNTTDDDEFRPRRMVVLTSYDQATNTSSKQSSFLGIYPGDTNVVRYDKAYLNRFLIKTCDGDGIKI